jgi:peptidoglycan/LPS O-acetylase OafA/YrhL
VEEQFYLLFPFLFWFTGFGRRSPSGERNLLITVGVLAVACFLMPTRFWQMAAGCLVFLVYRKRPALERRLERIPPRLVVTAMLAVLFAPLAAAVPATVAIVLLSTILLACLKQGTAAFRLFTQPVVVAIGLISESLNLWHWGVLSISRWTIGMSWWSALPLLLLMVLLAIASYRWVEQPFRRLGSPRDALIPIVGGVAAVGVSIADPVLHFPSRRCRTQDPPPVRGSLEQDRGAAHSQLKRPGATSSSAPHQSNRQTPALAPESHQATTHQLA